MTMMPSHFIIRSLIPKGKARLPSHAFSTRIVMTDESTEIKRLAARIADRIFPTAWDWAFRDTLERLLIEFAAEIKRSASVADPKS